MLNIYHAMKRQREILKPKYSLDLHFSSASSAAICTNIVKLQLEEQQLANEMLGCEQLRQSISFKFVMWVERGETTCATRRCWLHPVARLIDKFIALDMELQTFRVFQAALMVSCQVLFIEPEM